MAFENLSERLQGAIRMFRNSGKITEDDLKAPLREVRMALLEADVNFKVVKDFVATIRERAVGEIVNEGLTPGQQIIKIVNEELTQLLGGTQSKLAVCRAQVKPPPPASWPTCCAKRANTPCWWQATFTVRLLSSNCRFWVTSSISPYLQWVTRYRLWKLPKKQWQKPTA